MAVAQTLRETKQMATERAISDTLKSTPFFFLCDAVHAKSSHNRASFRSSDTIVESLYTEIAQFPDTDMRITINTKEVALIVLDDAITWGQRNTSAWMHALLILQNNGQNIRNSVRRVSELRLSQIQQICSTSIGFGIIPTTPVACSFHFDRLNSQSLHMVKDRWTSIVYPVATNIWRRRGARKSSVNVLVVLTTNSTTVIFTAIPTTFFSQ